MRILVIFLSCLLSFTVSAQRFFWSSLPQYVVSGINYLSLPSGSPATYNNIDGLVIENLQFTNTNSGSQDGNILLLNNCTNVTIRNCYFGASYGEGVHIENGNNITVENCLFGNNRTGVYALTTTGNVKVTNCQFINIHGKSQNGGRGQVVQMNQCTGAGNLIENNRAVNFYSESDPEDLVNIFSSLGTSGSPFLIQGNAFSGGGPSSSGGGIIGGDADGQYITITNNKLLNPGQYGIAVAGGNNINLTNNKIYATQKSWNNIGMYVWNQYAPACFNIVTGGNEVHYINAGGTQNDWWWEEDGTNDCTGTNVGPSDLTIEGLAMPNPVITYVTEDQVWEIRKGASPFYAAISANYGGISRPVANAGTDQSIIITTATLNGASSTGAASYQWVQVSGPNTATMATPTAAVNNLSGLAIGTYRFRLEVTHSNGAQDSDWVTITRG